MIEACFGLEVVVVVVVGSKGIDSRIVGFDDTMGKVMVEHLMEKMTAEKE